MNSNGDKFSRFMYLLRGLLRFISCMIAAAGLLMILRNVINTVFLKNYEQENYSRIPEVTLLPFRFGQNYVVPYNMGNIEYRLDNYEKAVSYYQQALAGNPP